MSSIINLPSRNSSFKSSSVVYDVCQFKHFSVVDLTYDTISRPLNRTHRHLWFIVLPVRNGIDVLTKLLLLFVDFYHFLLIHFLLPMSRLLVKSPYLLLKAK